MRLQVLRKQRGWTQQQFAVRLGVPLGTLQKWEQGAINPSAPSRKRICDLLKIRESELFDPPINSEGVTLLKLPLLKSGSEIGDDFLNWKKYAHPPAHWIEKYIYVPIPEEFATPESKALTKEKQKGGEKKELENAKCYKVRENSMQPIMREGDAIAVSWEIKPKDGDIVAVLDAETKEVFARQLRIYGKDYIFRAMNPSINEIRNDDRFLIVGKVLGVHSWKKL